MMGDAMIRPTTTRSQCSEGDRAMTRNFDALRSAEEEQIKLARSMTDSTIRNLLRGVGVDDLDARQLRRLAGVAIVAARRKDTAALSEPSSPGGGDMPESVSVEAGRRVLLDVRPTGDRKALGAAARAECAPCGVKLTSTPARENHTHDHPPTARA